MRQSRMLFYAKDSPSDGRQKVRGRGALTNMEVNIGRNAAITIRRGPFGFATVRRKRCCDRRVASVELRALCPRNSEVDRVARQSRGSALTICIFTSKMYVCVAKTQHLPTYLHQLDGPSGVVWHEGIVARWHLAVPAIRWCVMPKKRVAEYGA